MGRRVVAGLLLLGAAVAVIPGAGAEDGTFSCVVTAGTGAPGADFTSTAGVALGGCVLTTVSQPSVATRVAPAAGCDIRYFPVSGTGGSTIISPGAEVPGGSKLWAYCAAGVTDATNVLVLGTGEPAVPVPPSGWTRPVAVGVQDVNEPLVTVAPNGTVYLSATRKVFRSTDDGATWTDVSPTVEEAPPAPFTDTSISVAPDGTVWFTRFWGYPGSTLACRSTDEAETWTCDNTAIPGLTDRMWIVGVSKDEAYLQTMQGLTQPIWARTDNGGTKFVPYATWSRSYAWNGNLVRDPDSGAVYQLFRTTGASAHLEVARVDNVTGVVTTADTGMARPSAFPYLSIADGTLWTTAEPASADGSRSLVVARSSDQGATWQQFAVPTPAASVVFSTIAAGAGGHVAAVFYGSDTAGDPDDNGGTWSLYVAESRDAGAAVPAWTVYRLADAVHRGSICAGLNCQQNGSDPTARSMGDFMGSWIDSTGRLHVAFQSDGGDGISKAMYMRQQPAPSPSPSPSKTKKPKPK